jgi:CHASE2 domain-containing sensor protein
MSRLRRRNNKKGNRIWLHFKDIFAIIVFLKILLLSFAFIIHFFESLNPIEKALEEIEFADLYYKQEERTRVPEENNIVIINTGSIQTESIGEFRSELANNIAWVDSCIPAVIACDIIFDKDSNDPIADQELLTSLSNCKNLVLGSSPETKQSNHSPLLNIPNASYGSLELVGDSLEVMRAYPLRNEEGKDIQNTFAFELAKKANPNINENTFSSIHENELEIDYQYHSYHYNDLLDTLTESRPWEFNVIEANQIDSAHFNLLQQLLKDKIVIFAHLGSGNASNLADIEDRHLSPHGNEDIFHKAPVNPGVFIHAEVLQMILNNRFLQPMNTIWTSVIENLLLVLIAILYIKISNGSAWFKPIVVPLAFALSFLFIFISLTLRDSHTVWNVGFLNLQIILMIEVLEFYEPIALWMNRKWKIKTVFSHHE